MRHPQKLVGERQTDAIDSGSFKLADDAIHEGVLETERNIMCVLAGVVVRRVVSVAFAVVRSAGAVPVPRL